MKGRGFRESGRRPKELSDELELYVSVPRAASFAASFRIGGPQLELALAGASFPRDVITDVFDCFELLNAVNFRELEERIPDESYFRNFVGLAEQIAPDGEKVRRVGFTVTTVQGERHVVLTPKQERIRGTVPVSKPIEREAIVEIVGTLLVANAKSMERGRIEVVDDEGKTHRFAIPRGMMSDIVKPMFEERVIVTARRVGALCSSRLILLTLYDYWAETVDELWRFPDRGVKRERGGENRKGCRLWKAVEAPNGSACVSGKSDESRI